MHMVAILCCIFGVAMILSLATVTFSLSLFFYYSWSLPSLRRTFVASEIILETDEIDWLKEGF